MAEQKSPGAGLKVIDLRTQPEYNGGHITGSINRPFSEDMEKEGTYNALKPVAELEEIYGKLIPEKNAVVIVHCRTGHQASQTYFILARLLGYTHFQGLEGAALWLA